MKLGGFKNNEYLIRHKLKDINTVGNTIMKLISLSLPCQPSPSRWGDLGAAVLLPEVCQPSHWPRLKRAFENLSAVGNRALADKMHITLCSAATDSSDSF